MGFRMNDYVVVIKNRLPLHERWHRKFGHNERARKIPTGLITRIVEHAFTLPYSDCFIRALGDMLEPFATSYLRKATKQERFIYEMNGGPIEGKIKEEWK